MATEAQIKAMTEKLKKQLAIAERLKKEQPENNLHQQMIDGINDTLAILA